MTPQVDNSFKQSIDTFRRMSLKEAAEVKPLHVKFISVGAHNIRLPPEHPNHVWSYDFVEDRTHDDRKYRMLNIVDEFTHECLTDLLDLIEEAEHAERLAKRQRELLQAESPAITAEFYCLRTFPVIEITLGLGNDCSVRLPVPTNTLHIHSVFQVAIVFGLFAKRLVRPMEVCPCVSGIGRGSKSVGR
jgi:hypothetical protein